jgi:hypothetical protein
MNQEEFVEALKRSRDLDVRGIEKFLTKPAGRNPAKRSVEMSEFYNSLNDEQKKTMREIIKDSINSGLWTFLTILDHVSFIEGAGEKTTWELYAIKDGERTLINDPDQEELHVLFSD